MEPKSERKLIAECSQVIYDGFVRYNDAFHKMTRRAQTRFEDTRNGAPQGDAL